MPADFRTDVANNEVIAEPAVWHTDKAVAYLSVQGRSAFLTATETRAVIAALQATLPAEEAPATPDRHKVSTAADLDALPVGAKVEDREGDVWTRAESRRWVLGLRPALAAGLPIIPATFLPGTLLNPEILDAEPEPTTAGTVRLDLRLFLGDRDITYALANPIADALEG